ncbi:MAG: hypothetical protein HQL50_04145 [Magnetococcales bacterium]|nr:hypothetical protein [Magnetococcales bacterium]
MAAIGIGNVTGESAKAPKYVLEAIHTQAKKTPDHFRSRSIKGAFQTAEKAKGFSKEAVQIQFSEVAVKFGRIYAAPQTGR